MLSLASPNHFKQRSNKTSKQGQSKLLQKICCPSCHYIFTFVPIKSPLQSFSRSPSQSAKKNTTPIKNPPDDSHNDFKEYNENKHKFNQFLSNQVETIGKLNELRKKIKDQEVCGGTPNKGQFSMKNNPNKQDQKCIGANTVAHNLNSLVGKDSVSRINFRLSDSSVSRTPKSRKQSFHKHPKNQLSSSINQKKVGLYQQKMIQMASYLQAFSKDQTQKCMLAEHIKETPNSPLPSYIKCLQQQYKTT